MGKKGGKKGGTKGKKSKGGVDPEVQRVALARIGWGESTAPFQSLHDLSLITERAMSVNQTNTVHQAAGGLYPLLNSRPHPSKLRFDRCMICQTETAEPLQEIDCNCDKSIPPYAAAESCEQIASTKLRAVQPAANDASFGRNRLLHESCLRAKLFGKDDPTELPEICSLCKCLVSTDLVARMAREFLHIDIERSGCSGTDLAARLHRVLALLNLPALRSIGAVHDEPHSQHTAQIVDEVMHQAYAVLEAQKHQFSARRKASSLACSFWLENIDLPHHPSERCKATAAALPRLEAHKLGVSAANQEPKTKSDTPHEPNSNNTALFQPASIVSLPPITETEMGDAQTLQVQQFDVSATPAHVGLPSI